MGPVFCREAPERQEYNVSMVRRAPSFSSLTLKAYPIYSAPQDMDRNGSLKLPWA